MPAEQINSFKFFGCYNSVFCGVDMNNKQIENIIRKKVKYNCINGAIRRIFSNKV